MKTERKPATLSRRFYPTFKRLAIPIALQHMVVSAVNFLDVLMLTRLGTVEIAGVGLANQVYFLMIVLNYGLYSGMGVFLAQYWGKKDLKQIHRTLGLGLLLGSISGMLFSIAAFLFPLPILRLLSSDVTALQIGASYLRIVAFSYLTTSVSLGLGMALRCVENPKLPLISSVAALTLNLLFNYLLIFGKCGFPQLGADGAAVGTVVARGIEFLLLLFFILRYARYLLGSLWEMLDFERKFVCHYVQIALPVILNESLWGLGMVMYVAAYEKAGTDALAVSQVTSTIHNIAELVAMGIGNAAAVMIGNVIGQGWARAAYVYAKRFLYLSVKFGIATGIVLIVCIPGILWAVAMPVEVERLLMYSLFVCAALIPVKNLSVVIIVGILRGGGDTRYAMILEILNVWLIGVPVAFIGALVFKLPIHWLMLVVGMEEFVKVGIGIYRTFSGKWIQDVT